MNEANLAITAGNEPPARHATKLIGLFILVLLPLYLFGNLAEYVVKKEVFFFDVPLLLYLHQHASPVQDAAMIFFLARRFGAGDGAVQYPNFFVACLAAKMATCAVLGRHRLWGSVDESIGQACFQPRAT